MTFYISVEGNIGSGKSEFIQLCKDYFNDKYVMCRKENKNKWKSLYKAKACESNLLDLFYQNTKRWAYTFELRTTMLRFDEYKRGGLGKKIYIGERCWMSDRFIFSEMLFDNGCLTPLEKELYNEFYDSYTKKIQNLGAFIYLRKSPEDCYTEMTEKNPQDIGMSIEYIQKIHEKHEQWLLGNIMSDTPVIVIDVNSQISIAHQFSDIIDRISEQLPFVLKYVDKK